MTSDKTSSPEVRVHSRRRLSGLRLAPSLFVRRDWDGAIVYAREPDEHFRHVHYALSLAEALLLRDITCGRKDTPEGWSQGGESTPALVEFVEWACRRGILVDGAAGAGDQPDQFDPALDRAKNGPRPQPCGNRLQYPVSVTFLPTLRCSGNCSYCFLGERESDGRPLTLARIRDILDQCRDLLIHQWSLSGGDVMLYGSLTQLLKELADRDMKLLRPLSTKVPLPGWRMRELHDLGIRRLQFSLDTIDPDKMVAVMGWPYQECTRYIRGMLGSIRRAGRAGIEVTVRSTVTKAHVQDIVSFVEAVAPLGPSAIAFSAVAPMGHASGTGMTLTGAEWEQARKLATRAREAHPELEIETKPGAGGPVVSGSQDMNALQFRTRREFAEAANCPAARSRLYVLPDGRATFCTMPSIRNALVLGDLKTQSLQEVWHSEKAWRLAIPYRESFGDTPCRRCDSFSICNHFGGRCLALIAQKHGVAHLDQPDPHCPESSWLAFPKTPSVNCTRPPDTRRTG